MIKVVTNNIRGNINTKVEFDTDVEITSSGIELFGELASIFDELKKRGYTYEELEQTLTSAFENVVKDTDATLS